MSVAIDVTKIGLSCLLGCIPQRDPRIGLVAEHPGSVVDQKQIASLISDQQVEVQVSINVAKLEILSGIHHHGQALRGFLDKKTVTVVDENYVLPVITDENVRTGVPADIRRQHGIRSTCDRQTVTRVREETRSIVQVELVNETVLRHNNNVRIPITIEVRNGNVFAISVYPRQSCNTLIFESSHAIVNQQDIRAELIRNDDVQVPIAIEVRDRGVHAQTKQCGKMCCRDILKEHIRSSRSTGTDHERPHEKHGFTPKMARNGHRDPPKGIFRLFHSTGAHGIWLENPRSVVSTLSRGRALRSTPFSRKPA